MRLGIVIHGHRPDAMAAAHHVVAQLASCGAQVLVEDEVLAAFASGSVTSLNAPDARADVILSLGGDGTLHEVVNGLFIQQEVCPDEVLVAVVAVGTGNDWVRTFGISNRYQDAVKAISEGYSFLQDVGVVSYEEAHYRQSRYMVNVAAAGYEAQVVRCFNHLKKKGRRGRWLYTLSLIHI